MDIERKRQIVLALRRKADSTTFPAEASALRSKADELESRYNLGRIVDPPPVAQVAIPWGQGGHVVFFQQPGWGSSTGNTSVVSFVFFEGHFNG
jgi:hypothetical protein